jgi:hypothetical protein
MAFRFEGVNWEGRSWRCAASIVRFGQQIEALRPGTWPTDGTVASKAHDQANPKSDHRPDSRGVVRAIDVGEPSDGWADMIGEQLRVSQDPRLKYWIHDRRIFSSYQTSVRDPWEWGPYDGASGHLGHFHMSVVDDERAELGYAWDIRNEDDMAQFTDEEAKVLRDVVAAVNDRGSDGSFAGYAIDLVREARTKPLHKPDAAIVPSASEIVDEIARRLST